MKFQRQLLQNIDNNRIGRELAEGALRKADNGQKKAENALKESKSQVTSLTSQLLLAEEQERKRIARELHDGLGQSLNAISMNVRTTLEQVGDKVKTGFESLEAIMPIIHQSIEEVQRIGMNLRPSLLDDLGSLLPPLDGSFGNIRKFIRASVLKNRPKYRKPKCLILLNQ